MPQTRDSFPGKREEEATIYSGSEMPLSGGEVTYFSDQFWAKDLIGTFPLRGGGSLDSGSHGALRQLIHLADGGGPFDSFGLTASFSKCVSFPGTPWCSSSTWYNDASLTKKIVEKVYTRNPDQTAATITWRAFDINGSTVLSTVVDTLFYSGIFETHRSRSMT